MADITIPIIYSYDDSGLIQAQRDSKKLQEEAQKFERLQKQAFESVAKAMNGHADAIKNSTQAQELLNRVSKLSETILINEAGSYNALKAELELVTIAMQRLTKEELKNSEAGKELISRYDSLEKELSDWESTTKKAEKTSGGFVDTLAGMDGAAGKAAQGVKGLGGQFRILLRNPVVAVLGAIIGALGALFAGFTRSEQGAGLLAKATGVLNGLMSTLTEVSVQAVESIKGIFDGGIEEGLKNIGKSILDNVVNRFKAIPDIVFGIGDAISSLVSGDFEAAGNAAEDVAQSFLQVVTGFDTEQQATIADGFSNIVDRASDLSNAYIDLAERQRALRLENIALTRSLGEYQEAEALAAQRANDSTLGFEEQKKALEELEAAQQKRLSTELRIAQNNLSTITQEVRIRRSTGEEITDLLEQQAAAITNVQAAERELTTSVAENARTRREIRRDEFERELDFAIDFFDAQKTQLERQINDEENRIDVRADQLDRLKELDESAFSEQIKLLEDFTGQRLNIQELALEQDERIVRERLRQANLDDVTLGRILEVLRERKAATADIADAERELNKARVEAANAQLAFDKEINQEFRDLAATDFEEAQALQAAKFELTKASVFERTKFELEQERAKLLKILELNETFNDGLSDVQIETIQKTIEGINENLNEIDTLGARFKQKILDTFGIDDEQAKAIFGGFETAFKNILDSRAALLEAEIEAQGRLLDSLNERIDEQENALDRELELKKAGFANNFDAEKENLEALQIERETAQQKQQELQEKAAKQQFALDTLQQVNSLITASANIFKGFSAIPILGVPLAIAAIGTMLSFFVKSKADAAKLSGFKKGGNLGDHFSGITKGGKDDAILATTDDGNALNLHGKEMVVNAEDTAANKDFLIDMNNGEYRFDNINDLVSIGRAVRQMMVQREKQKSIHNSTNSSNTVNNAFYSNTSNTSNLHDLAQNEFGGSISNEYLINETTPFFGFPNMSGDSDELLGIATLMNGNALPVFETPEVPDYFSNVISTVRESNREIIKEKAAKEENLSVKFDELKREMKAVQNAIKEQKKMVALPTGEIYEETQRGNTRTINIKKVKRNA